MTEQEDEKVKTQSSLFDFAQLEEAVKQVVADETAKKTSELSNSVSTLVLPSVELKYPQHILEKEKKVKRELSEVLKGRELRKEILQRWGGVVIESVLQAEYTTIVPDAVSIERNKEAIRGFAGIDWRKKGSERISRFPKNICQLLVNFYTMQYDTIIDPFAGHNSRMQAVYECGRNYIGFDCSKEYMTANESLRAELESQTQLTEGPKPFIELFCMDSKKIDLIDSADMCLTSPPYWRQERYTDEPEQLYFCHDYHHFLRDLKVIMSNMYRALRKNSWLVWNCNDFRQDGRFYNYHGDTITLLQQVGFTYHDIFVLDYGKSIRSIFVNQIDESKIAPKRHEYLLIFRKV